MDLHRAAKFIQELLMTEDQKRMAKFLLFFLRFFAFFSADFVSASSKKKTHTHTKCNPEQPNPQRYKAWAPTYDNDSNAIGYIAPQQLLQTVFKYCKEIQGNWVIFIFCIFLFIFFFLVATINKTKHTHANKYNDY